MTKLNLIISLISINFIFACAHVSQKDCLEKDWQSVGLNDALAGKPRANMQAIAESCSRFSMANPPESQYQIGYDAGLKQYCNKDRGYAYGERGNRYPSICDDSSFKFPELLEGWHQGLDTYCSRDQGIASAKIGNLPNRFCTKVRHQQYYSGFAEGAKTYCSNPHTGFLRGKSGEESFSYCPDNLAPQFDRAYTYGREVYRQIASLQKRINTAHERELALIRKDKEAAATIRNHEYKIKALDKDLADAEKKERALEKEIEECKRKEDLCSLTYLGGLKKKLKTTSNDIQDHRRRIREYTLSLPGIYADQTRFVIELSQIRNEKRDLERDLSNVKAKDYTGQ